MIWSDMLQPRRQYGTEGAVDLISQEVVLLDFVWYFYLDYDIEDHLLSRDRTVIMGNLYSSHYPRFDTRIAKPGMVYRYEWANPHPERPIRSVTLEAHDTGLGVTIVLAGLEAYGS